LRVSDFIARLDFFLHYVHEDYIEEFGRNVMEAMAAGRVVILPHEFSETFGDGAVYCDAADVARTILAFWSDLEAYRGQAKRGLAFVHACCGSKVVCQNISSLLTARE